MEIIPAIDLLDNKCVRLTKGKFDEVTTYGDPIIIANELEKKGAKIIHLCDLNRARDNSKINSKVIRQIIKDTKMDIQIVGGIKNADAIREYMDLGVKRIVMSAATILGMDDKERRGLAKEYSGRLIISVDGLGNILVRNAWQEETEIDLIESARKINKFGFNTLIYTDVSRDGTLTEPNYLMIKKIMNAIKQPIIVAGGVSSVNQLAKLKDMGAMGAIFGKALFSENFNFEEAIRLW